MKLAPVERRTGIVYDPVNALQLDAYLPRGVARPPVAVYLHGGAWLMGHRGEFSERLEGLAAQGVAVVSIDYRTVDRAAYPAQHEDVLTALRWVGEHANELGTANGPAVLMGSSAGAHLAALTALSLGDGELVGAFVGLFGRYDLSADAPRARAGLEVPQAIKDSRPPAGFESLGPRERTALLAGTGSDALGDDELHRLSPISHVSDSAPAVLLVHGTADAVVDHAHSLALAAALATAGTSREATVVLVPGANHEDPAFAAPELLKVVADFARRSTREALTPVA